MFIFKILSFCLLEECVWAVAFMGSCGLLFGCTDQKEQTRFMISGTVTYGGQPVKSGLVKFYPDLEKGGKGVGDYAPIKDGAFCTVTGLNAGPMKVTICGLDGISYDQIKDAEMVPEEYFLFKEYPVRFEVKREDANVRFEVPGSYTKTN